jgi:3-oxoacyl-[acyl-carrier-protein] synthase-1
MFAIGGLGTICASGYDVPATMGSIVSNVQLFDDLDVRGPGSVPITGASTRLPRTLKGIDRLSALALLAVEEASAAVDGNGALPVLLCTPEITKEQSAQLLEAISGGTSRVIDRARSVVLPRGRSAVLPALQTATQWFSSGRTTACLLVGVDSLLDRTRLSALIEKGEVLCEGQEEGYVPGEAAAALLLTPFPSPDAPAMVLGLGLGTEQAASATSNVLTGDGFSRAADQALQAARIEPARLDAIAHECTGLQAQFEEFLLARGRRPLDGCHEARTLTASLSTGEVGAASGVLSLAMMTFFVEKGLVGGPAVCLLRGEGGERGAVVIGQSGRRRRT